MSEPTNFGDTLSSGIQDVAALLPLLGTEQCERHVGTALEKGYLYAAATPLSIFGSLGIVKTAFSTLLATTTQPFYGSSWLDDAGFDTAGSVSSMATLVKGTQQYGAEVQLQRLMKEQHIDDPDLITDIEWFGWERLEKKTAGSTVFPYLPALSWNVALILTSLLSSVVSISPYLYLIHNSWGIATLWLFPLLRSFGALLCVVSIQFALQIRIHRITTTSLQLMKARKRLPLLSEGAIKDRDTLLETRLRNPRVELSDPEKQSDSGLGHQTNIQDEAEARGLVAQGVPLFLLQVIIIVGMGMIVAGYVGCFNIVGRTNVDAGPYVWFGMETFLAMLRIVLWGWNPLWDEGGTGMTIRLNLRSRDSTCSAPSSNSSGHYSQIFTTLLDLPELNDAGVVLDSPEVSDVHAPSFPHITTPQFLSHLTQTSRIVWKWQSEVSVIVESIEAFLAAATPYVGPLRRLESEELKGISLYCGIVPHEVRKLLCITACRDDSRWTSISVLIDGSRPPYAIYASHSRDLPGARALQVTLKNQVQPDSATVIDRQMLDLLIDYSSRLFSRLCVVNSSIKQLPLSWAVTLPSLPNSEHMQKPMLLTKQDRTYIRIRQIQDLKRDYCLMRGNLLLGVFPFKSTKRHDELVEWALILDSAVMEAYLCICEHQFVQSLLLSPAQSRRLALEWIHGMEDRISSEKEACQRRQKGALLDTLFLYEMTHDRLVQELRFLRQLPINSPVLRDWKGLLTTIMDQPDDLLPTALFEIPPLQNLDDLQNKLLSCFVTGGTPTGAYYNMIAFLRSSLYRLRDAKASSLYDRLDPYGPGSPEFSPPYTCVHDLSERTSKALTDQMSSVSIIDLDTDRYKEMLDALRLFDTLPPLQSLTTVKFYNRSFTHEVTCLVISVMQQHPGIICLALDDCTFSDGRACIDDVIATNRRKWKEEAQKSGKFKYRFGCEIRTGHHEENHDSFATYQRDILLSELADLFVMIYIPQDGEVVPILSLQAYHEEITLVALLRPSAEAGEAGDPDGTLTTQSDVPASYEFETISVEGFLKVKAGCYELRIRLARKAQYLFRSLTVNHIPASDGAEPSGGPEADGSSTGGVSSSSSNSSM
ncbi:hypothetical protein AAF712_004465 [Marasmius tenuissimus]|uniref:Uncharacterized protein n=1 Tax=Marasmius tenuissimus TaxID=585030 RepID=A0ABR3A327_9AGAR